MAEFIAHAATLSQQYSVSLPLCCLALSTQTFSVPHKKGAMFRKKDH
jgi:hypothetical protein